MSDEALTEAVVRLLAPKALAGEIRLSIVGGPPCGGGGTVASDHLLRTLLGRRLAADTRHFATLLAASDVLESFVHLAVRLPHEDEATLRTWASGHPAGARWQGETDAMRKGLLRRALAGETEVTADRPEEDVSRRVSAAAMAMVVGYQSLAADGVELEPLLRELVTCARPLVQGRGEMAAHAALLPGL